MNDKEKLISFINKGKENKPVKEVHVIKDSPTEAHILLVNEDGTNVASNRFEIMNANDLMTLIENPTDSGLLIYISEGNKKVVIKNSIDSAFARINLEEFPINDNAQWHDLYLFTKALYDGYENGFLYCYCRKFFINDYLADLGHEYKSIPLSNLLTAYCQFLTFEGSIGDTTGKTIKGLEFNSDGGSIIIRYSDGTGITYAGLLTEYEKYKQVNGEFYINYEY